MADDIKPRLRVPTSAKKGEVVEIKTLITHPMETGQRKDADGKIVPRLIVNALAVTYNGKPVLNAKLEPAVAANPYLAFFLKVEESRHAQVHLDRRQQAELDRREQDRRGVATSRSLLGARHSSGAIMSQSMSSRHWSGALPEP